MTEHKNGRAARKRRAQRVEKSSNPNASRAMKAFWQDPERVARWRDKHDRHMAARRADPLKAWSRMGVPDGMNREEAEAMWAHAKATAKRAMDGLRHHGYVAADENPHAIAALETAVAVMYSGHSTRERLKAARTVLMFTKGKPARQRGLTIKDATDWLDQIAAATEPTGAPPQ